MVSAVGIDVAGGGEQMADFRIALQKRNIRSVTAYIDNTLLKKHWQRSNRDISRFLQRFNHVIVRDEGESDSYSLILVSEVKAGSNVENTTQQSSESSSRVQESIRQVKAVDPASNLTVTHDRQGIVEIIKHKTDENALASGQLDESLKQDDQGHEEWVVHQGDNTVFQALARESGHTLVHSRTSDGISEVISHKSVTSLVQEPDHTLVHSRTTDGISEVISHKSAMHSETALNTTVFYDADGIEEIVTSHSSED